MWHHFMHLVWSWWAWRSAPADPQQIYLAGPIFAIILAIGSLAIKVFAAVGKYILDIGNIVFTSLEGAARFSVRGVGWLTGLVRKGYGLLSNGLGHIFDHIQRWLRQLYEDYAKVKNWLDKTFAPIVRIVQTIRRWYDLVWKQVLEPVINLLQRFRKVLFLFRLFHLKWAEKLDNDLAYLEGKIVRNFLVVRQWLNLFGAWVTFLVDPAGALRTFPLVAGIIAGINVAWSGLFGTPFTWWPGAAAGAGITTHVSVTFAETTRERQAGAGDAGTIRGTWGQMQAGARREMRGR